MTTVSVAVPVSEGARVRDTRTFRRVGAALLMPLGPLVVAIVRLILPYLTNDDAPATLRKITAAPGRETAVVWLSLVLVFTLVPSVLAAGRVTIRRAPVLSTIALIMLVPGFIALLFTENDPIARVLVGFDPTTGTKVLSAFDSMSPISIGSNVFVLAHVVGIILLGVAALRARVVPPLVAWLLIVSQPLHVIFAIVVPVHALDAGAWVLTAIGFAFLARTALRTSNDAWDLPPIG